MKQIVIIFIFALSLLISCKEKAKKESVETAVSSKNKIELIDFYGTHRCVTCKAIEANAKYTVETFFSKEQENGTVIFKTVNVDDDKNYKMAENYEATGTALFLNVVKEGKETHIDLTEFAFAKGKEREEFSKELKVKIDNALKEL